MLRAPRMFSIHASRPPTGAATSSDAKGALSTCSSVNRCCAPLAGSGARPRTRTTPLLRRTSVLPDEPAHVAQPVATAVHPQRALAKMEAHASRGGHRVGVDRSNLRLVQRRAKLIVNARERRSIPRRQRRLGLDETRL